jgi:hypothetical protein
LPVTVDSRLPPPPPPFAVILLKTELFPSPPLSNIIEEPPAPIVIDNGLPGVTVKLVEVKEPPAPPPPP